MTDTDTPDTPPALKVKKSRGGQPGRDEYRFVFCKHAYRFALLGYSDEEIARELGIGFIQFRKWKTRYPVFAVWIKKGRARVSARVAKALFKNAMGFWSEDTDTRTTTVTHPDGTSSSTSVTNAKRKYYAPNVTAQIFWLKNRARKHWYDMVALPAEAPVDPAEAGKKIRDAVKAIRSLEGLDAGEEEDVAANA